MDYYQEQPPFGPNDPYAPPKKRGSMFPEDEETELKEKVTIPIEKYPGYNFVGSLLGPQGSILKAVQKATRAKMSIFGKGSMKDKKKEEDLTNSEDAEHAHLKEPLHVLIEVKAPRAEAHWRMSNALVEVYKFMVPPDKRDQMQGGDGQYNERQGGGGHYNEGPFDPYAEGGYGGNYMQEGGPPLRGGGGGGGRPRGGAPQRGGGGGERGGGGGERGGGGGGGGPPRDRGAPRGRGGHGGAPPQSNSPASHGANRPRGGGGARGPAPQAEDQYGYNSSTAGYNSSTTYNNSTTTETTNYQWDGNYSNNNRTAEAELSTSNGFTLKRFHDSYDDSY